MFLDMCYKLFKQLCNDVSSSITHTTKPNFSSIALTTSCMGRSFCPVVLISAKQTRPSGIRISRSGKPLKLGEVSLTAIPLFSLTAVASLRSSSFSLLTAHLVYTTKIPCAVYEVVLLGVLYVTTYLQPRHH